MKIISYVGAEGECIVIERPQDIFPLLDWAQTQLMDIGAKEDHLNAISRLMDIAEQCGLGSSDDIDNVVYE